MKTLLEFNKKIFIIEKWKKNYLFLEKKIF